MLGALAKLAGSSAEDLQNELVEALKDPASEACAFINEYDLEYEASVAPEVVENLRTMSNGPAADVVLPIAALVANVAARIIEPDGTPILVNGGGTILFHVGHPASHYHSTLPAWHNLINVCSRIYTRFFIAQVSTVKIIFLTASSSIKYE